MESKRPFHLAGIGSVHTVNHVLSTLHDTELNWSKLQILQDLRSATHSDTVVSWIVSHSVDFYTHFVSVTTLHAQGWADGT